MGPEQQIEVSAGFSGGGQLARLEQLDQLAAEVRTAARPRNTVRAYAAAWRLWEQYTLELGIPAASASEGALVGFVLWYAGRGARPDTIRYRLAAVVVQLRERGVEPGSLAAERARGAVDAYEREVTRKGLLPPKRQAPILREGHLEAMLAAQPDTLRGIRDAAVLAMWFGVAVRRSELAVQREPDRTMVGLMVSDITVSERGMLIDIRVSKTGAGRVSVPRQPGSALCPVAAWERWHTAAGLSAGPAFRRLHSRYDTLMAPGIGEKAVRDIITRAERLAGLEEGYTGHSGRRTFVTRAVDAGASMGEICAVTRHAPGSRVVHEYYQVADAWTQNPLSRIID